MDDAVVIEAALNGGRSRDELPAIPLTPSEVVAEARRCADAGASVVHVHARGEDGGWSADPGWYGEAIAGIRAVPSGLVVSITSIRPMGVDVEEVIDLLAELSGSRDAKPDLISVNLGHIAVWERDRGSFMPDRRTLHFPNSYDDVNAVLTACRMYGIVPEFGVMDIGFVSNAVALDHDGLLHPGRWFLIELDSPGYGRGPQVAPSTVDDYRVLADRLRTRVPGSRWAAHGNGRPGYAVIEAALGDGAHARVGFEDAIDLPDGRRARSNGEIVAWAVAAGRARRRRPASAEEARRIIGAPPR